MGDLPSTFADIRALMVAESWWAKEFFEDIGAVRKSATITKYQAFNDLTLHASFSSTVRQIVFPRDIVTFSCSVPREIAWHIANKACTLSVGLQKEYP